MTPAQATEMLKVLHDIQDGMFWACVWLFCILVFKDCKGGK